MRPVETVSQFAGVMASESLLRCSPVVMGLQTPGGVVRVRVTGWFTTSPHEVLADGTKKLTGMPVLLMELTAARGDLVVTRPDDPDDYVI